MSDGDSPGPNWKLRLVLIGLCAVTPLGACVFLRIFKPADVQAYIGMASECDPVWKQFALRQFGRGDSVKRLFQRFPPTRREEFGRYGVYSFASGPPGSISFTSFSVVTRDGKLLSAGAGSCTWGFAFFITPDRELDRQYAAMSLDRHIKSMQRQLDRLTTDLQRFYREQQRWPMNEGEFGTFVTGQKPTELKPDKKPSTLEERRFRQRYGLDQAPAPFNPLGIILNVEANEQICITFKGEPGLANVVRKPGS